MSHLDRICRRAKAEAAIMRKLHCEEGAEERKIIEDNDSIRAKMMQLPHIASAMELKFGPSGGSGAGNNPGVIPG